MGRLILRGPDDPAPAGAPGTMRIDLRTLDPVRGHIDAQSRVPYRDVFGTSTSVACAVGVDYRHTGGSWFFHGIVRGRLLTPCHRCLEPTEVDVEGDFDVTVRRSDHAAADLDEAYLVLGVGEHEIELEPFIDEAFVVSVPMLVVCRDDCRGLCPSCGANLNRENCTCERAVDPRWEGLLALRNRMKDPENG